MGVNVPCDKGIEIDPACVGDHELSIPDILHVQNLALKGSGPGDQRHAWLRNQNGLFPVKEGAQNPADLFEIIPVIRLVAAASKVTASHIHVIQGQVIFPGDPHSHGGEGPVDLHGSGLGGGMEVESRNLYVGKAPEPLDGFA